jgi:hypothetical protein
MLSTAGRHGGDQPPWAAVRGVGTRTGKGTVEAAVRRLARGGEVTVQCTLEMFEIMIAALLRED